MTMPAGGAAGAMILGDWYAGEVGGEALFWRLAESADRDLARKWLALAALEGRVAERLLHALLVHDLPVPSTAESLEWARCRADAYAKRPWREQMAWLSDLAAEALGSMRREAGSLAPPFAELAALVVRHEQVLLEFAELELGGHAAGSVARVEEFLATTPRP